MLKVNDSLINTTKEILLQQKKIYYEYLCYRYKKKRKKKIFFSIKCNINENRLCLL